MALVPFLFLPHYDGKTKVDIGWERFAKHEMPIYACPDGSGLIIDGTDIKAIGSISILNPEYIDSLT